MGLGCEYRIEINGKDVTSTWRKERRLIEIEVEDKEGESSDSCSLTIDDREPHVEWPPEGARLRISLGNSMADLTDMGADTLDAPVASSPPDRLRVVGHAATFVSSGPALPMQTQRSRLWHQVSIADMVETIARDHDLIARVQQGVGGEVVEALEQIDESDIAFLSRIAGRLGAKVRIKSASGKASGAIELVGPGPQLPQIVLHRRNVERWSAPLGGRLKPGTVVATWHRPKSGAGGQAKAGKGDPRVVLTETFDDAQSAKRAAKAALKKGERKTAQIEMDLTYFEPAIASGTALSLQGFRSEINTIWAVTRVRHKVNASQARTTLTAERIVEE